MPQAEKAAVALVNHPEYIAEAVVHELDILGVPHVMAEVERITRSYQSFEGFIRDHRVDQIIWHIRDPYYSQWQAARMTADCVRCLNAIFTTDNLDHFQRATNLRGTDLIQLEDNATGINRVLQRLHIPGERRAHLLPRTV